MTYLFTVNTKYAQILLIANKTETSNLAWTHTNSIS